MCLEVIKSILTSYLMQYEIVKIQHKRFRSVVVITSASHAEGPGFEPRRNLNYIFVELLIRSNTAEIIAQTI